MQAFIDTVKNGFIALFELLTSAVNLIFRTIAAFAKLLGFLPDVIQGSSAAINMLPSVVLAAALFCLSVRLIIMIVQKKAGGD